MQSNGWIKRMAVPVFAAVVAYAEPSVYVHSYNGGGSQATKNKNMIYTLQQKVARQQEEIEGLKSLIESLSQRLNQLASQKRSSSATSAAVSPSEIKSLEERIAKVEKRLSSSSKPTASTRRPSVKSASGSGKKPKRSTSSGTLEKAPSNKLFSRGVRLINQKRYAEAKRRFDILLKRNYKPASTNFYLGEIAYRSGRYDEAIKRYQKSAELNENAAYMDRLLLHTAIALERSGDRDQARNFFQAIVDGYPGTSSAREAKKHLK